MLLDSLSYSASRAGRGPVPGAVHARGGRRGEGARSRSAPAAAPAAAAAAAGRGAGRGCRPTEKEETKKQRQRARGGGRRSSKEKEAEEEKGKRSAAPRPGSGRPEEQARQKVLALHVCQLQNGEAGLRVRLDQRRHHGPSNHGGPDQARGAEGVPHGQGDRTAAHPAPHPRARAHPWRAPRGHRAQPDHAGGDAAVHAAAGKLFVVHVEDKQRAVHHIRVFARRWTRRQGTSSWTSATRSCT